MPGNRYKSKKKRIWHRVHNIPKQTKNPADINKTTVLSSEGTKHQNEIRNTTESSKNQGSSEKIHWKYQKKSTGNQDLKITLKKQTIFLQKILFYGWKSNL